MLQEIQLITGQANCVLVSTGYSMTGPAKTTIDKRTISIAPATDQKKKINFKTNPYTGPQAASIARRNARERNRVKQVNDGFAALRRHLPAPVIAALSNGARRNTSSGKKLSKVDTLRMVVEYIRYLQGLLDDGETDRTQHENNENFYFAETSPSPVPSVSSESSSGVSSGYSVHLGYPSYDTHETHETHPNQTHLEPMDDEELLDVISWWQQK